MELVHLQEFMMTELIIHILETGKTGFAKVKERDLS